MANFDDSNTAPEGTTLVFGSWVCKVDGVGGFSSHLVESTQPVAAATNYGNNADSTADDLHEPQLSELIGKYLDDLKSIPTRRINNSDLTKGIDRVSKNIVECIELAQATLPQ